MTENPPPPAGRPGPRNAKAEAKAAKAYAKAERPWFKKKRFIIPLALVALMVIAGIASGGGGETTGSPSTDSASTSGDNGNSDSDSDSAGKTEEPSVKTEAAAMVKEFEDNEMAADSKYKGKWVEVSGTVSKVETETFNADKYYPQIGGGTDFELVFVNCHGMSADELSSISKGDAVTVVGKFDDGGTLGVELKNCRLA